MKKNFTLSSDIPIGNNKDNLIQKNPNNLENLNEIEDNCGCGCSSSSDSSQTPSLSMTTDSMLKNSFEKQQIQKERERKEDKQAKILILIGLALTIPLVTLELLEFYNIVEDNILLGFIFLFLATPIQFLLGRPFYKRFYHSIRKRKSFTVDTLVVLSTSVAYVYSVIALLTNQGVSFF